MKGPNGSRDRIFRAQALASLAVGGALALMLAIRPVASAPGALVVGGFVSAAVMAACRVIATVSSRPARETSGAGTADFDSIFETSGDGLIIVDETGRIERSNTVAARIFGCDAGDLTDAMLTTLIPSLASDTGKASSSGDVSWDDFSGREVRGLGQDGLSIAMRVEVVCPVETQPGRSLLRVTDLGEESRREETMLRAYDLEVSRIGKELHRGPCQNLTAAIHLSESVSRRIKTSAAAESNDAARLPLILQNTVRDLRRIIGDLDFIDVGPGEFLEALNGFVANMNERSQVTCELLVLTAFKTTRLEPATELLRLITETVYLAADRASARSISIELWQSASGLRVDVVHDGKKLGLADDEPWEDFNRGRVMHRARGMDAVLIELDDTGQGHTIRITLDRPAKAR